MAASRSRGARRRRVLNDEVRAQAGSAIRVSEAQPGEDAPRYGEQANVENHPQITDFVPRQKRVVVLVTAALIAVAVGSQVLAHYAQYVVDALPQVTLDAVRSKIAGGVVAWTSAAVLLVGCVCARIIFSLRRHRVDDQHGRYRVWRWAALAAVVASVNAVVGAHQILAPLARAATGWSLTHTGAEWWLTPTAIVGGWITVRLLLEIAESRLALSFGIGALACYGLAAAGALGWSPAMLGEWSDLLTHSLPLVGHILALGAGILFARYVVLDVQGLIERRAGRFVNTDENSGEREQTDASAAVTGEAQAAPPASQWVDGSEPEVDDYDPPKRKLTKAERKRLRKQQMRDKAA